MGKMRIGCGQITWMKWEDDKPVIPPVEQVLGEIAQAGYEGAPAGARGDVTAAALVEQFSRFGLKPAPGYLGANFWDEDERDGILERAKQLAVFMREVGCTELFVAPGMNPVGQSGKARMDIAGRVTAADFMSDAQFAQFAKVLNEVGEITLKEGVKSCFHNHVGSAIETREEIDKLFSLVDRDVVFQGPDIGHLMWGGADPVQFCRDYADSIKALHIKDIYPNVLQEGREKEWTYAEFSKHGIFAELGEGMVDFPAMFDILSKVGFDGWVIVETDVTTKSSALESATISRKYLQSIGL
jgi:inosose dehydratase